MAPIAKSRAGPDQSQRFFHKSPQPFGVSCLDPDFVSKTASPRKKGGFMRILALLIAVLSAATVANANAQTAPSQEPVAARFTQPIDQLSNDNLERLSEQLEQISQLAGLSNCGRFVHRVKMNLPQNINYDAPLNEFMSRVEPEDGVYQYNFGILTARAPTDNSMAKLAAVEMPDETKAQVDRLNSETNELLKSDAQLFLMAGTAVYSPKENKTLPDIQTTVRAIVDSETNEFVMLGLGQCLK
jgi:hypothetical protein